MKTWLSPGLPILVLSLLASCAASTNTRTDQAPMQALAQPKAAMQNRLPACISVSSGDVLAVQNVLLLPTQLTLTQSIGACGCMSSLMRYRVSVGGPDAPLSRRDFVVDLNTRARRLHQAEVLHLVLAPDVGSVASASILTVELTCTPAE